MNLHCRLPTEHEQVKTREILGEKYRFAEFSIYIDKNEPLSNSEYEKLVALGWLLDGFNKLIFNPVGIP